MMFFVEISDVIAGEYPSERNFRIGGLVVDGSVKREEGSLDLHFRVTDMRCELDVSYTGVLPDLFREGQGVVAHGRMGDEGVFIADKILAKHDENYMAPEVAESLGKHVQDQTASLTARTTECGPE
jgi:cytochrome c-type biogenesis protein CcmE